MLSSAGKRPRVHLVHVMALIAVIAIGLRAPGWWAEAADGRTRSDASRADSAISWLRDGGRTIIMFELPLPPFRNRYGDTQRRLAARHGVLLIPKRVLIGVMTSEGATLDTIHLSDRGHALMAETVWNIIGRTIGP
jgi:hypothetical protein